MGACYPRCSNINLQGKSLQIPQVINMTSELIAKLKTLAPQQQQQVLDFVEFLAQKYAQLDCYLLR